MLKYDKLDLVSLAILKILSDYSFQEVQVILKKTEYNVASTYFCGIDKIDFDELIEDVKNAIV